MDFKVEDLAGSKKKFSFVATVDEFNKAVNDAYIKNRSKISVPGFRKGKAPKSVIERMYGKSVFYEDALDIVIQNKYEEALKESEINPISRPEVNVEKFEDGKDIEFSVEFAVYPTVKLGDYKGIAVNKYVHQVNDEDVQERLEVEQKKQARKLSVTEGMIEPKDTLTFDYVGSVDGVEFEGGKAENATLKIGSGQFIPGFEDQLIGMELGTEGDIKVKFPEEYHAKDLTGKDAVFHVNLHSVEREELPELDDDFAQDVSEFDTLDEYKESLRKQLQEEAEKNAESRAKQEMYDILVKNSEFEIPDAMVEAQMDRMLGTMDQNLRQQGMSLDQFLQMVGNDKNDFREQYRDQAKHEVASELVLEELVKAIDYQVSDDEVMEFIDKAFAEDKDGAENFKKMMTDIQKENIAYQIKNNKSIDEVWKNAVVTTIEGDAPVEEMPVEEANDKAQEEEKPEEN